MRKYFNFIAALPAAQSGANAEEVGSYPIPWPMRLSACKYLCIKLALCSFLPTIFAPPRLGHVCGFWHCLPADNSQQKFTLPAVECSSAAFAAAAATFSPF